MNTTNDLPALILLLEEGREDREQVLFFREDVIYKDDPIYKDKGVVDNALTGPPSIVKQIIRKKTETKSYEKSEKNSGKK